MEKEGFQRARQPHQKAQRRAIILQAAREMLEDKDLAAVSLNRLAERVGLAKSNVVRYFETREAILMQILQEDIEDWVNAQVPRLQRMRTTTNRVDRLVEILVTATVERPRLCMLGSVVAAILERNVKVETATAFKKTNRVHVGRLVSAMADAVPELSASRHGELIKLQGALVAGLWQHARPSDTMIQVLEDPDLQGTHIDFERALRRGTQLIAAGLVGEVHSKRRG